MIEEYQAGDDQLRDGRPWPFVVINAAGQSLASDSLSELVDHLFPEHVALDSTGQFELRLRALAESASLVQAIALATLESDGGQRLPEAAVTVAAAAKDGPVVDAQTWPFDMPLYLLATQYAPFTDVAAPQGEQVVLLNPSTERTFLEALHAVGDVEFLVNGEGLTTAEPSTPA